LSADKKKYLRPIASRVDEETLEQDLERFKQAALTLGATDARIIPADWVQVDERVRLKCSIPPCPNYNRCGNCPPYTPEPDFMRKAFARYQWALLFKHDVPARTLMAGISRERPMRLLLNWKYRHFQTDTGLRWGLEQEGAGIQCVTADSAR